MNHESERPTETVRKSPPGFTLVEVMIALSVFAVGLSAVLTMLIQVQRNSRACVDATHACFLAHRKMEELMSLPPVHAMLAPTRAPDGQKEKAPHEATAGGYAIEWEVRDIGVAAKKISLVVRWTTGFARNDRVREYRLTSVASGVSP